VIGPLDPLVPPELPQPAARPTTTAAAAAAPA